MTGGKSCRLLVLFAPSCSMIVMGRAHTHTHTHTHTRPGLNSNGGFSLSSTMVAAGMASMLALGVAHITRQTASNQKYAENFLGPE